MTEPNEEALHTDPPEEQPLGEGDSDNAHPMDVLLESESYDLEMPRRGEIRTGTVARVTETDVLVDVGAKSEGVIQARELERLPLERREALTVGTEVDVYVIRSGGKDGTLILSVIRAEEEQDWRDAERLLESRDLYEGIISGYNKGGLIVKLGRLRGFVPASQVSLSRRRRAQGPTPEKRWSVMVDEPIIAKVIEVDRRRNRLILSERAAAREARDRLKERLIAEMEPGEIRKGHVISLANFGAFVDIGGADGLVHTSEISWKRIEHPREVLKVGQEIEVKVLGVDPDRRRISLSMRELEPDPWDNFIDQYREGQLVEGAITKLTKFGAFASIVGTEEYDFEGLIHISELSDQRIEHPREVVKEEQLLPMRVIKIDRKRRRIGLSLRKVDSVEYAEQDWQAAMADIDSIDEEEIAITLADEAAGMEPTIEDEAAEVEVAEGPEAEIEEAEAEEVVEPEMMVEEAEADEVVEPEMVVEEGEADEVVEPEMVVEEAEAEEVVEPEMVVEEGEAEEVVEPEMVVEEAEADEVVESEMAVEEAEVDEVVEPEMVVEEAEVDEVVESEMAVEEAEVGEVVEPEMAVEEAEADEVVVGPEAEIEAGEAELESAIGEEAGILVAAEEKELEIEEGLTEEISEHDLVEELIPPAAEVGETEAEGEIAQEDLQADEKIEEDLEPEATALEQGDDDSLLEGETELAMPEDEIKSAEAETATGSPSEASEPEAEGARVVDEDPGGDVSAED